MEHPAYSQLRPVTPSTGVVLCDNPSYQALEGTNSWIIRAPGDTASVIVDPGPQDEGHLNVLWRKASEGGAEVALILLTHHHPDHADGAARLRQLVGAPVRAFDKRYCLGGEPLVDGEFLHIDGLTPSIEVLGTPGHTDDSVCFAVHTDGGETDADVEGILTGDTIAGRHTTMISETTGDLGDYLESLRLLARRGSGVRMLPGHGPDRDDTAQLAESSTCSAGSTGYGRSPRQWRRWGRTRRSGRSSTRSTSTSTRCCGTRRSSPPAWRCGTSANCRRIPGLPDSTALRRGA
jgi:glyoxylase-like metal-dependent hydrolase (beta-lactamase superfamily II)